MSMKLICIRLAIACVTLFPFESKEESPINDVIRYWKSIQASHSVDPDARFLRMVGFIEGALEVKLPEWWIEEGLTPFAPKDSKGHATVYGAHPKDELETTSGTFSVVPDDTTFSLTVKKQTTTDEDGWITTTGNVLPGLSISGRSAMDCELVVSKEYIYVFGRNGQFRYIVAFSSRTGDMKGFLSFSKDGGYIRASILRPPKFNDDER